MGILVNMISAVGFILLGAVAIQDGNSLAAIGAIFCFAIWIHTYADPMFYM